MIRKIREKPPPVARSRRPRLSELDTLRFVGLAFRLLNRAFYGIRGWRPIQQTGYNLHRRVDLNDAKITILLQDWPVPSWINLRLTRFDNVWELTWIELHAPHILAEDVPLTAIKFWVKDRGITGSVLVPEETTYQRIGSSLEQAGKAFQRKQVRPVSVEFPSSLLQ